MNNWIGENGNAILVGIVSSVVAAGLINASSAYGSLRVWVRWRVWEPLSRAICNNPAHFSVVIARLHGDSTPWSTLIATGISRETPAVRTLYLERDLFQIRGRLRDALAAQRDADKLLRRVGADLCIWGYVEQDGTRSVFFQTAVDGKSQPWLKNFEAGSGSESMGRAVETRLAIYALSCLQPVKVSSKFKRSRNTLRRDFLEEIIERSFALLPNTRFQEFSSAEWELWATCGETLRILGTEKPRVQYLLRAIKALSEVVEAESQKFDSERISSLRVNLAVARGQLAMWSLEPSRGSGWKVFFGEIKQALASDCLNRESIDLIGRILVSIANANKVEVFEELKEVGERWLELAGDEGSLFLKHRVQVAISPDSKKDRSTYGTSLALALEMRRAIEEWRGSPDWFSLSLVILDCRRRLADGNAWEEWRDLADENVALVAATESADLPHLRCQFRIQQSSLLCGLLMAFNVEDIEQGFGLAKTLAKQLEGCSNGLKEEAEVYREDCPYLAHVAQLSSVNADIRLAFLAKDPEIALRAGAVADDICRSSGVHTSQLSRYLRVSADAYEVAGKFSRNVEHLLKALERIVLADELGKTLPLPSSIEVQERSVHRAGIIVQLVQLDPTRLRLIPEAVALLESAISICAATDGEVSATAISARHWLDIAYSFGHADEARQGPGSVSSWEPVS